MALADDCTEAEFKSSCEDVGNSICSGKANLKMYDESKCLLICAGASIAAMIIVPLPFGFAAAAVTVKIAQENAAECYSSETEFEKCFNDFTDVGICCMKYKIKCNVFVYQEMKTIRPARQPRLPAPTAVPGRKNTSMRGECL